jgi:uncharacterized protein
MQIREMTPDDIAWALPLNQAHIAETSALTAERMAALVACAFQATAVDTHAFLLTFDQSAPYDSPNFLWFRERYPRFVYVDRIIVSQDSRGRGLARLLYESLFNQALVAGHENIVCEVNSDPPNPASDVFHARLGFAEVGSADLPERGKTVRYLLKQL